MRIAKSKVMTKEDIEQYYSHCRKIKFADEHKPENLRQVFEIMNTGRISKTFGTRGGAHCSAFRSRSIDDYIALSKYYFPDLTVKEILKEMLVTLTLPNETYFKTENLDPVRNKNIKYTARYCPTIRKDNFYMDGWGYGDPVKTTMEKTFKTSGFPKCNIKIEDFIK